MTVKTILDNVYSIMIFLSLPLIFVGIIIGIYFFMEHVTNSDAYKLDMEERRTSTKEITEVIKSNKLSCEYIGDLRLKYAGSSYVEAIDQSWIDEKLRTYWNVHSCGEEWNWWD